MFLPGHSAEKSVFLPSEKIFRGLFPMDEGTLIPGEYSKDISPGMKIPSSMGKRPRNIFLDGTKTLFSAESPSRKIFRRLFRAQKLLSAVFPAYFRPLKRFSKIFSSSFERLFCNPHYVKRINVCKRRCKRRCYYKVWQ